ncbi:MAG: oxidoreductase [bacterium]|nr:oxidoreductase [bacterium]
MTNNKKKVALVTGASSGIGKEVAKRLLSDGLTVIVVARTVDKMADLQALGAHPMPMDITVDDDVQRVVADINKTYGGVDVLVNNAGFGCYGAVEDVTIDDARYQFEVNLFGLARLTQLILPNMRDQKSGIIVNISSMGGKIYTPMGAWYHASKHALEGWSDCLRLELAPFGIHVVVIEPGIIETGFGDVMIAPMMKRSGAGAYGSLAQRVAKATESSYADGNGSSPSVVANAISSAIKSRRPKTRYVVGKLARPLILARKWLGDRFFDRIMMSAVK